MSGRHYISSVNTHARVPAKTYDIKPRLECVEWELLETCLDMRTQGRRLEEAEFDPRRADRLRLPYTYAHQGTPAPALLIAAPFIDRFMTHAGGGTGSEARRKYGTASRGE